VRWPHPTRHDSPAEFIPVAEETGLINPLGGLILRRACTDAALWPDDVPRRGQPVAFAVSGRRSACRGDGALNNPDCQPAVRSGNHRDLAVGKEQPGACHGCTRCARLACAFRWMIFGTGYSS